jgi:hypothetical protein
MRASANDSSPDKLRIRRKMNDSPRLRGELC